MKQAAVSHYQKSPGLRMVVRGGLIVLIVLVGGLAAGPTRAQDREYVVGVGDQLDIQVFNQVQPLDNFSTRAEVRSDRMITMPWLGDIKAAGLKKSTLTSLLESNAYLGKFLTDPHVTITPGRMAANILVVFSGVVNIEQEIPRDTKFGQLWREIAPRLQEYEPNLETISIHSVEGEVFAPDVNLRLQWGDGIRIPAAAPTPLAVVTPLPQRGVPALAQFTAEEYQTFQEMMQAYPEAWELLRPLVRHEPEGTFLDLILLTDAQQAELPQAVVEALQQHLPAAELPIAEGIALLGIRPKLNVDGSLEAFLAFPQPEGDTLIRRAYIGDVIQPGDSKADDLILAEIDNAAQQVLVKQGQAQQALPLTPPFSNLALVGIVNNQQGQPEAILQTGENAEPAIGPTQRKRYTEGQEIAPGIRLVKIVTAQHFAVVRNTENQAVQVLFLRDSRTRPPSTRPAESEQAAPFEISDPAAPTTTDPHSLLKQQMPPQIRAIDTLSQLFFATPLF